MGERDIFKLQHDWVRDKANEAREGLNTEAIIDAVEALGWQALVLSEECMKIANELKSLTVPTQTPTSIRIDGS